MIRAASAKPNSKRSSSSQSKSGSSYKSGSGVDSSTKHIGGSQPSASKAQIPLSSLPSKSDSNKPSGKVDNTPAPSRPIDQTAVRPQVTSTQLFKEGSKVNQEY
jgi:hypothetical protein